MPKGINVLIVGANRGIGFQLVKAALSELQADKVFATYRSEDKSKDLLQLASENPKVQAIQLDSREDSRFPEIVKLVDESTEGKGLNLLINNAGIFVYDGQTLESITKEAMMLHFEVNAVAPLLLVKAFLPLLEKAAKSSSSPLGIQRAAVVNVSSLMGSIEDKRCDVHGGGYAYKTSKTALNMVNKCLTLDLKEHGILSIVMNPGWVRTDMGGPSAPLSIEDSVSGMIQVISNLNESHDGQFFDYNGDVLPW